MKYLVMSEEELERTLETVDEAGDSYAFATSIEDAAAVIKRNVDDAADDSLTWVIFQPILVVKRPLPEGASTAKSVYAGVEQIDETHDSFSLFVHGAKVAAKAKKAKK